MRDWIRYPTVKHERVVFLDRDGTINIDTHYPYRVGDLEFIPGALEALKILAKLSINIIVITNQAGIALGYFTVEDMSAFNRALREEVEENQGRIDAFYYCPHLEPKDLPPEVSSHDVSDCVKPSPGMLLEAAVDFDLDLSKGYLVGDKTSDIAAGERVGCTTILVKTGKAGKEEGALPVQPDYIATDLLQAAKMIRSDLIKVAVDRTLSIKSLAT